MDKNKRPHILVIRLSAMGDAAMTVPVLVAFVDKYPTVQITVLTRSFFKPMFSQLKNVEVFEADVKGRHKGVFGLWKLYKELKLLKINAVADLHNVLRSKVLKRYFGFDKTPFKQIDKNRAGRKALTRSKNKVFKPLTSTHQRYVDVFTALGFPFELESSHVLAKEKCPEKVNNLIGQDAKQWIGIAPFAAFAGKMYPLELMQQVVDELNASNKFKIFLFGGGVSEKEKLKKLESSYENAVNVVGKLSYSEELALVSNLDLMVSMDSGNGHLAAMYGVPVVSIWGVTHPYAGFYPFGQPIKNALLADRDKYPLIPTSVYGNKVPEGYERAIETVSPKQILSKIYKTLDR
ncbi:glycosyltransferase family 9 protein [Pseudozobellia sp. WGM2]|uniref:glycosyltransferase family 9 protein n=1 Tax=Pseudozobellia sp. WGM2 TaxID=2787625 RepID=UPI00352CE314